MSPIEYINPDLAAELGWNARSAADPGNMRKLTWMDDPNVGADGEEEHQAELESPRIPDYAALKKHKHYRVYFRPHRYRPFPAMMYHRTMETKIVNSKEQALALGPDWSDKPFVLPKDMTGKTLPVENDVQRMSRVMMEMMARQGGASASQAIDPAVMATAMAMAIQMLQSGSFTGAPVATPPTAAGAPAATSWMEPPAEPSDLGGSNESSEESGPPDQSQYDADLEREAMIMLAEEKGLKIDRRWGNARLKEELGL